MALDWDVRGKPSLTLSLRHRSFDFKKGGFRRKPVVPNFVLHGSGRELSATRMSSCRDGFVLASRTGLCFAILRHLRGCPHFSSPFESIAVPAVRPAKVSI
jgi:hypothetical protein